MTLALLISLIVVNVAYLVLLDRRDSRAEREHAADRDERQTLLQRIQAPESATYEHATQHLPPDGSGMPMSDEQLAEQEERERVLQFIERHEAVS